MLNQHKSELFRYNTFLCQLDLIFSVAGRPRVIFSGQLCVIFNGRLCVILVERECIRVRLRSGPRFTME